MYARLAFGVCTKERHLGSLSIPRKDPKNVESYKGTTSHKEGRKHSCDTVGAMLDFPIAIDGQVYASNELIGDDELHIC